MLEKTFEIHPEVYKYSHSAYSQPSILFYGDSEIKSCEGTHQGDPESPVLISDFIQDLIDSLESKINLWDLDDGNLSDDYRTVLKDLKNMLKRKKRWDSKLNPRNVKFFSLRTSLKTPIDNFSIFLKTLPRDQNTEERGTYQSWYTARPEITSRLVRKKINEMEKVNGISEKLDAHFGFFVLKNCFSLPKLLYFLRTSTWFNNPALLEKYATGFPKCLT